MNFNLRKRDVVIMAAFYGAYCGKEFISGLFRKNLRSIEVNYEEVKPEGYTP